MTHAIGRVVNVDRKKLDAEIDYYKAMLLNEPGVVKTYHLHFTMPGNPVPTLPGAGTDG